MAFNSASSVAANYALLNANTNVASQESCNNMQVVEVSETTATFGSINCQNFTFGKTQVTANQTCNQYSQIAILAKVVADQSAKSESIAGIGFFEQAKAEAVNYIQVQNNLSAIIAASCTNSQKLSVGTRTFTAGTITGEQCDIYSTLITQEAMCLQTVFADITNSTETSQDATAKATAGLDLGQILLFLIILCVVGFVLALLGAVIRSMLRGGSASDILGTKSGIFGSGGPPISTLRAKLKYLDTALSARQTAQQNLLKGSAYLKK